MRRFLIAVVAPTGTMYLTTRAHVISPSRWDAKVYTERGIAKALEYASAVWAGRDVLAVEVSP